MTAKLVKARPKSVEYLPEWAKCCPEFTASLMGLVEITVDISDVDIPQPSTLECAYCKALLPISKGVPDMTDGQFIPLELLDLDEGVA